MALICARFSCARMAAASIQFDAGGAKVMIIDLTDSTEGIPICRSHARTRTAPVGWTMHDHRSTVQPTLWPRPEVLAEASAESVQPAARQTPMIDSPASPLLARAFRAVT